MKTTATKAAARLAQLIGSPDHRTDKPKGWYDLDELTLAFNMRWRHNASSRAIAMHKRGVLERRPHRGVTAEGQTYRSFIYRPVKPARTIAEALDAFLTVGEERPPKGWARPVELAEMLDVSAVAVREMCRRRKLKGRYFRTLRGLSGLHQNLYYPIKAVMAHHLRKS